MAIFPQPVPISSIFILDGKKYLLYLSTVFSTRNSVSGLEIKTPFCMKKSYL
jgi:hypothetical protein